MKRTRRPDETPWFKLEWYDDVLHVWKPARSLYPSVEEAARVARTAPDRHWRLMRATGRGYEPVLMPSIH